MNDKKVDILLISYVFPPYPGIGGRRWAKFAKYLTQRNYRVHVICASNPFKETSLWTKDIINNENIIFHKLKPKYPSILLKRPNNLMDRLSYKIWNLILPFFSKGNHYDRATFWEKDLIKKCEKILKITGTKNIIVSGAPFNCNYFVTQLKKRNKELNLISDLRDPWTWANAYGLGLISTEKRKKEEFKEREVISLSDTIFVPVDIMKEHLQQKYPEHKTKIFKLPHGYDSGEIPKKLSAFGDGNLKLMFYGNIYEGIGPYFLEVAKAIKQSNNTIFLDFYSDTEKYKELFVEAGVIGNVRYFKPVQEKILLEKMSEYSAILIVYPNFAINFISTKFYEIIYTKSPIFYIGNPGKTSEFITENRLGHYIEPENIPAKLISIHKKECVLNYNFEFDITKFSLYNLTTELISFLKI